MGGQAWKTVSVVAAAIVFAAGCGSDNDDDGDGAGSTTPAETSTSAASTVAGDYGRTVTKADIARTEQLRNEAGPNQEKPEPGSLRLTLSDGTLKLVDPRLDVTILQDFSATSDGAFQIGAYQHPETGSFCGPDIPQTASYTWERSGEVLTLKADDDPCADRDSMLTGDWKAR